MAPLGDPVPVVPNDRIIERLGREFAQRLSKAKVYGRFTPSLQQKLQLEQPEIGFHIFCGIVARYNVYAIGGCHWQTGGELVSTG